MPYETLYSTVVAILTAIITGGFILIFVEIGNRKNREIDSFYQSANPLMNKLSSYLRLISWCNNNIQYPKSINEKEENFKSIINWLSEYGNRLIMSGGNYSIDSFNSNQIKNISNNINNIWYWYDKMDPCRLCMDNSMSFPTEFVRKEISAINPAYLLDKIDVGVISRISGDFYADIYRPIKSELDRHESYMKQYALQTYLVSIGVLIVLFILCFMLFTPLPIGVLQMSSIFVILWLAICLLLLGIDMESQVRYKQKISKVYTNVIKRIKHYKAYTCSSFHNVF